MLIFSVSFQFYRMIPEGNPRSACKIEEWGLESTWSTLQFYQLKPCNLPTCSLPSPIVKDIMLTFIHHPATCANIFTCFYYRKSKLFLQLHCWDGSLNPALAYCLRIDTVALSWCVSVSKPCKVTKASSKQAMLALFLSKPWKDMENMCHGFCGGTLLELQGMRFSL